MHSHTELSNIPLWHRKITCNKRCAPWSHNATRKDIRTNIGDTTECNKQRGAWRHNATRRNTRTMNILGCRSFCPLWDSRYCKRLALYQVQYNYTKLKSLPRFFGGLKHDCTSFELWSTTRRTRIVHCTHATRSRHMLESQPIHEKYNIIWLFGTTG